MLFITSKNFLGGVMTQHLFVTWLVGFTLGFSAWAGNATGGGGGDAEMYYDVKNAFSEIGRAHV